MNVLSFCAHREPLRGFFQEVHTRVQPNHHMAYVSIIELPGRDRKSFHEIDGPVGIFCQNYFQIGGE